LQQLKVDNDKLRGELEELRKDLRDLKDWGGFRRRGTR
jgi:hypothetical protein